MPCCSPNSCDAPPDKYKSPDCIKAEIVGLGAKYNCTNPKIFLPNITRDSTINGFFGADHVVQKLEVYNDISSKRCNPFWMFLVTLPLCVTAIVLFTLIRGNSYTCTGSTKVCGLGTNETDCNAFWCCDQWPSQDLGIKEIYADPGFDFADNTTGDSKCQRVLGNASMMVDPDAWAMPSGWDITLQEGCASGKPLHGCQCTVSYNKNGAQRNCQPLFMQGNPDNFSVTESNFALYFTVAMVGMQLAWIVPLLVIVPAIKKWKAWTQEYFADWIAQGVEVNIVEPVKKRPGRIVFVFPPGTYEKYRVEESAVVAPTVVGVAPTVVGQSGSSTTGVEMVVAAV